MYFRLRSLAQGTLLILSSFVAAPLCNAQIKIDLKTPLEAKSELAYIKSAAKSGLENTKAFVIREFGEK
ncbi:MAG: hypothetical protein ACK5H0_04655 [Bacteroidota bacterium]|jgi:hypothetical protein